MKHQKFDPAMAYEQVQEELGPHSAPKAPVKKSNAGVTEVPLRVRPAAGSLEPSEFKPRCPSTIPRRSWLYGHHVARGTLSLTVSPGGVGKSSLLLAEAVSMASGQDFLGAGLPQGPQKVWCINGEEPNGADNPELDRRVNAICNHHGVGENDIGGRLFLNSAVGAPICLGGIAARGQGFMIEENAFISLEAAIAGNGIDVLIIDPLVSFHGLNENDNMMMDLLAKRLIKTAMACNCAISIAHHTSKQNGSAPSADNARGASALVAAARVVRLLLPMTKSEGEKAGLDENAHRRVFRTSLDKQNMRPADTDEHWLELCGVELGNGDATLDLEGDCIGVVARYNRPAQWLSEISWEDRRDIQEKVQHGEFAKHTSKLWVGHAIAEVLGLDPASDRRKLKALIRELISQEYLRVEKVRCNRSGRDRPMVKVGRLAEPPTPPHLQRSGVESRGTAESIVPRVPPLRSPL